MRYKKAKKDLRESKKIRAKDGEIHEVPTEREKLNYTRKKAEKEEPNDYT